ncbi:MAG: 50S ribosomal protein L11 methyltransferase [Bdellovibrionota bacterium]
MEKAISILTVLPTSRVDEISYHLWEQGILGLQELPPEDELYLPQKGTEFREPQRVDDWTKDELLIESTTTRLKIFIPESEETFAAVKSLLDLHALPLLESEEILPAHYIEEYKKRVRGKSFGPDLWIGPPWVNKTPNATHFIIDPGMAFGTGEHPTTQMITEWLIENSSRDFKNIIDIGAGSGILSIVANRVYPAAQITATDLDLNCQEEIPKNFAHNQLSTQKLTLLCGESADLKEISEDISNSGKTYDLILSNIYGEVLAQLSPSIKKLLSPNGTWVATGVLDGPARQVFESALENNFVIKKTYNRRDESPNDAHLWLCYELTK